MASQGTVYILSHVISKVLFLFPGEIFVCTLVALLYYTTCSRQNRGAPGMCLLPSCCFVSRCDDRKKQVRRSDWGSAGNSLWCPSWAIRQTGKTFLFPLIFFILSKAHLCTLCLKKACLYSLLLYKKIGIWLIYAYIQSVHIFLSVL